MAKRDYYDVLSVPRKATRDEIRRAHRKLVRQFHPDVNKNNPQAEEKFKEVQEAYDVLSDEAKRQAYDQFGHAGVSGEGGGGGGTGPQGDPFEAFRRASGQRTRGGRSQWRAEPNVTVEDFDFSGQQGAGNFSDIFEQFFGRNAPGGGQTPAAGRGEHRRARPAPARGQDIEYPVTLTFAQAARGITQSLQINRDGKIETIDVKIPAGVKEGSRVRLRGRGQQSAAEPGDLYIVTKVLPHPYFSRDNLDIHLELPISVYEAASGAKVEVPTLEGRVTLTIPPGTSGGAKLRIKGHGIERGGEQGDEIVTTRIVMPKILDSESQQLFKTLQEKYPLDARTDVKW